MEEMIPKLYLKEVSTGGFQEALQSLLEPDCPGLSASTINRLTTVWQDEYDEWSKRHSTGNHYVFVWADGIYCYIQLDDDHQCLLALMGATEDGRKELIAVRLGNHKKVVGHPYVHDLLPGKHQESDVSLAQIVYYLV